MLCQLRTNFTLFQEKEMGSLNLEIGRQNTERGWVQNMLESPTGVWQTLPAGNNRWTGGGGIGTVLQPKTRTTESN
jgi:hypothetical protein